MKISFILKRGSEISSCKVELQDRVTQNDVTPRVTNSYFEWITWLLKNAKFNIELLNRSLNFYFSTFDLLTRRVNIYFSKFELLTFHFELLTQRMEK